MLAHFLPDGGKRIREGNDMPVLRALPHFAEARMIAVLLAALRVPARGLDVAVGKRANPHVGPSRRDCQNPDPFQHVRLGELRAVGARVRESFSSFLPTYTGPSIRNISQAHGFGSFLRIYNCLSAIRRID
jgi:hypothetical protein